MSPQLPSFLRRRLRLSEARKALLGGEPEEALNCLDDPCLDDSEEADKLRERVLDLLCREAAQQAREDNPEAAERMFERVSQHDAARARAWRRRLDGEAKDRTKPMGPTSGVRREAEQGIIGALEKLLHEMRDERSRSGVRRLRPNTISGDHRLQSRSTDSVDLASKRSRPIDRTFRLAIDDVGEFFCIHGSEVTLGHARAELADLPFMANLDSLHARLVRTESFHSGPGWRIEPIRGQRVAIDGQLVDPGGAALLDGDEVQLCGNLSFVFRRPEAASGTAILELLHGAECAGAVRVLLFAPGAEGRVCISSAGGRHFHARRLQEDITLWIDERELVVESTADVRAEGGEVSTQNSSEFGPGGLRVSCPPAARIGFIVGRALAGTPPFGFSIAPSGRRLASEGPA